VRELWDASFAGFEGKRRAESAPLHVDIVLRGLPQSDLVTGEGFHVKGLDLGGGLQHGPQYFFDLWILFPPVQFGILWILPEAHSQDTIGFSGGNQHDLIHEPRLLFENRQNLFAEDKLAGTLRLAPGAVNATSIVRCRFSRQPVILALVALFSTAGVKISCGVLR
jgi:hypothetical protein